MTFLKVVSIALLSAVLLGCSRPQIQHHIEYVEVKVPVVYKLDRPVRPKYTSKDTAPTYLLKIIEYTKTLEVIIDEHNQGL
jgi:hypothetical protein